MNDESEVRRQRSVLLSALLTVCFGAGGMFVAFLLCGGLSVYVLAVVGGFVAFGYLHYLLWGQSMARDVTGELEREARAGELSDEEWHWDEPHRHGRL